MPLPAVKAWRPAPLLVSETPAPKTETKTAAPEPATPQVVYVQQNRAETTNAYGIAAMVIGGISLLLCWIPIVNMLSILVGLLGLAIAGIGLSVSLMKDVPGIPLCASGAAMCLLPISVALWIIVVIAGAFSASAG